MWNEGYNSHVMRFGDGGWFLPMGVHGLFSLLLIGFLIYGVVLVVRHFSDERMNKSALDSLGMRYAAGEIDRDEYLAKKNGLRD